MKSIVLASAVSTASCVAILAGLAWNTDGALAQQSQNSIGFGAAVEQPCTLIETEPSVQNCFWCLTAMIKECNGTFPGDDNAAARQACYEGANRTHSWCINRIPVVVDPKERNSVPSDDSGASVPLLNLDVRGEMIIDAGFDRDVLAGDVRVGIGIVKGGKSRIVELGAEDFWGEQDEDGLKIVLKSTTMNAFKGDAAGIVMYRVDKAGLPAQIYIAAMVVSDSFDLNGDGLFAGDDRALAIDLLAQKQIHVQTVMAMFEAELD